MGYRFELEEEVLTAVRRIGHEETAAALADLRAETKHSPIQSVHSCRKHCKKVRGLIRLVRPSLGRSYRSINVGYRDVGRLLSPYRDAHALLAVFDHLVAANSDCLPDIDLATVRAELSRRSVATSDAVIAGEAPIADAILALERLQSEIDDWTLNADGWRAMSGGIQLTYSRGYRALDRARRRPRPDYFHELRKRAKYTWYHLRLLETAFPSVLTPLIATYSNLADSLGEANNLAVLQEHLRNEPKAFGRKQTVRSLHRFIDDSRVDLEQRSIGVASRLYVESPKQFTNRIGGYWKHWHKLGDELPAGEIEALFGAADDLDTLTVPQLRDMARTHDIPGRSALRRKDLLATLRVSRVVEAAPSLDEADQDPAPDDMAAPTS